jgi:hypothetical protein
MKATFKDLPKVSTNEIYAGKHWRARQKMKENYLWLTCNEIKKLQPVSGKVDLDFTFHFKSRPIDSSNTAYMAKLIEDCLIHHGILKNDDIKCVGKVILESKKSDQDLCILEIKKN